tara:strand:+ start:795 stop:1103 length:309 start_codon:yes stop_codon:yes gene_type:complete
VENLVGDVAQSLLGTLQSFGGFPGSPIALIEFSVRRQLKAKIKKKVKKFLFFKRFIKNKMKLQIFCKYNLKALNGPFIPSLPLIGTLMDNEFITKKLEKHLF